MYGVRVEGNVPPITDYNPQVIDFEDEKTIEEKESEHTGWIQQQNKINNLETQTILIKGETIRIKGREASIGNIKIIQQKRD